MMLGASLIRERLRRRRSGEQMDVGWKAVIAVLFVWFLLGAAAGAFVATVISFNATEHETWVCSEDTPRRLPEDPGCFHKPNFFKQLFKRSHNGS